MSQLKRGIKTLLALAVSFGLTSACGEKKNEGEGLSVAVQPGNEVLMGPGPLSNCSDRVALKSTGTLTYSVAGPVLAFSNFQLMWSTNETLYIQEIKWTVSGVGIANGSYTSTLTANEVENLIGLYGGMQVGKTSAVINSNDSSRVSGKFAPCGLVLGGIPLTNPKTQTPFKGTVLIEVIGTAEDSEGNQRFVRQRLTAKTRFEGI